MSTTKTRINISVSKDIEQSINQLAKIDSVPVATKARQLLERALEIEDNLALTTMIKKREKRGKFMSFESIWRKYIQ